MRRAILAICAAAIIFACNMLTPMTVRAEERGCPPHAFGGYCEGYKDETLYVHQYLIDNQSGMPNWGSCRVYKRYREKYNICSTCGYIDYANPYYSAEYAIYHESCGNAPYFINILK